MKLALFPKSLLLCWLVLSLLLACGEGEHSKDMEVASTDGDTENTEEDGDTENTEEDGDTEDTEEEGEQGQAEEEEQCLEPTVFPLLEPTAELFVKASVCVGETSQLVGLPFDEGEDVLIRLYNQYLRGSTSSYWGERDENLELLKTCLLDAGDCEAVLVCLDPSPADTCGGIHSECLFDPAQGLVAQGCTPFESYYQPCDFWCYDGLCKNEAWMKSYDVGVAREDYNSTEQCSTRSCDGSEILVTCQDSFVNTESGEREVVERNYRFDCAAVNGEQCSEGMYYGLNVCGIQDCDSNYTGCGYNNVLSYCSSYINHKRDCAALGKKCYAVGEYYQELGPAGWWLGFCVDPSFPDNPCCDFEDHCDGNKVVGCTELHGGFEVDCSRFQNATCVIEDDLPRCHVPEESE